MSTWKLNNIPDLSGKTMIVTGANSGLGYASAKILSQKGATVIMACRNPARGQRALVNIKNDVPQADVSLMDLDLASLASIEAFAEAFNDEHSRLDVLMNNAGVSMLPRTETEDGFEMMFGVNHLGHFALTGRLLDSLLATSKSRVVTVSSRMHGSATINWDDLMSERAHNKWDAYRQSKLANLLFAFELQRRLAAAGTSCQSMAAHPGFTDTDWGSDLGGLQITLLRMVSRWFGQKAEDGALSQLYAATNPGARGGGYYGPKGGFRGRPVEMRAAEAAYDKVDARRLWKMSAQLTGVAYESLRV